MTYKKINSYTWVRDDGKQTIEERERLINEQSISKSTNFLKEKKNRRPTDQNKVYEKFVNQVFAERKFICRREFHSLIRDKFNSNYSFYRRRMLALKLITEKNNLIKPFKNETDTAP